MDAAGAGSTEAWMVLNNSSVPVESLFFPLASPNGLVISALSESRPGGLRPRSPQRQKRNVCTRRLIHCLLQAVGKMDTRAWVLPSVNTPLAPRASMLLLGVLDGWMEEQKEPEFGCASTWALPCHWRGMGGRCCLGSLRSRSRAFLPSVPYKTP